MKLRTQLIIGLSIGVILLGLVIGGNIQPHNESSNQNIPIVEKKSDFTIQKERVLESLSQIQQSNNFKVEFDEDVTSKRKDGSILQVYKIIHNDDGWIGDLTFYYGVPDVYHPSKYEKIFQTGMFLSGENGVVRTTHSLSIVKNTLPVLVPLWHPAKANITQSNWIDDIIENSPINKDSERSGIVSFDGIEIRFDYRDKEGGYYRLQVSQEMTS